MKRFTFFNILVLACTFFYSEVKGGTVEFSSTTGTMYTTVQCGAPLSVFFNINGTAVGYNTSTDSINVKINFGDGQDTLLKIELINYPTPVFRRRSIYHTYTLPGTYSIQYIATGPDLAADTIYEYSQVIISDTCGNISGKVYNDLNSNCVFNSADEPIEHKRINLLHNNQILSTSWTDSSGNYWFEVPINNTYTVEVDYSGFSLACPSTGSYTINTFPSTNNDFALNCTKDFDLSSSFIGRSTPGQILKSKLRVYNKFCKDTSGTVKVVFNDSLYSYFGNTTIPPTLVYGDTIEWNFSNISNYWKDHFELDFTTYTDTTVQIGDTVCVTVIVDPIVGDSDTANNISEYCIPVRTSYDPNIKQVQPVGEGSQGKIAQNTDLTYTIHFQNTGTAPAYNIYILDTIDVAKLDLNSIEILGSSHEMKINIISSNTLRFRFEDIMLADSTTNEPASHGWLMYSIKQQANLTHGTQIQNSASIYFDYNPPVHTPATLNTIDNGLVGSNEILQAHQLVNVYPNPTESRIYVDIKEDNFQLDIYDLSGRMVKSIQNEKEFAVDNLGNGLYILKITIEGSVISQKLIVQH